MHTFKLFTCNVYLKDILYIIIFIFQQF